MRVTLKDDPVVISLTLDEARVLKAIAGLNLTVAGAVTLSPTSSCKDHEKLVNVLDDLFYALGGAGV